MLAYDPEDGVIMPGGRITDWKSVQDWFDSWRLDHEKNPVGINAAYHIAYLSANILEVINADVEAMGDFGKEDAVSSMSESVFDVLYDTHDERLFEMKARRSDLGTGEMHDRVIRSFNSELMSGSFYRICHDLDNKAETMASEYGNANDYYKYLSDYESRRASLLYDNTEKERDKGLIKDIIYKQEGISMDTSFENMPAYVSSRLYNEAGINTFQCDTDKKVVTERCVPAWRTQLMEAVDRARKSDKRMFSDDNQGSWVNVDGQWLTRNQAANVMSTIEPEDFDRMPDEVKSMLLLSEQEERDEQEFE